MLSDVPTCDTVNVYRRPEFLPAHTDEILALDPLPRQVWFQLHVYDRPSAKRLADAGMHVIQNRCMYADHRRLRPGPIPAESDSR